MRILMLVLLAGARLPYVHAEAEDSSNAQPQTERLFRQVGVEEVADVDADLALASPGSISDPT